MLVDLLRSRYGIEAGSLTPLSGGEACRVYCIDGSQPLVARMSPLTVAELAWTATAADAFGRIIPEVVRPIAALDGALATGVDGDALSVWPYVDGVRLDREDPSARDAAARLLAALHRNCALIGNAARPPSPPESSLPGDVTDVTDPQLDERLRAWRSTGGWPYGGVHGDFFRGNVLCRDGRIVGLIDWDEARVDYVATELAWSVWEFAKARDGDRLRPDRAADFLRTYREAGGPAYPADMLGSFIRDRLRTEIHRSRRAAALGLPYDRDYEAAEVRAFATVTDDLS
ncbi:MAG TPA: aminoglycoside phosphotransferase family protein [Micromonosporaceae bacterium]|jgi:Ser/Thr protein kinase RdoA (MazF antagonist)